MCGALVGGGAAGQNHNSKQIENAPLNACGIFFCVVIQFRIKDFGI